MLFQNSPYDEKDEDLEEKMIKEDKSKDATWNYWAKIMIIPMLDYRIHKAG